MLICYIIVIHKSKMPLEMLLLGGGLVHRGGALTAAVRWVRRRPCHSLRLRLRNFDSSLFP